MRQITHVEKYLENFLRWAHEMLGTPADTLALLSGRPFYGKVVGMAMVGAVCTPAGGAVIQALPSTSEAMIAVILAHETGHVLSMKHDGDEPEIDGIACPPHGFIMTASAPGPLSRFSTCSKLQFRDFLRDNQFVRLCLSNVPKTVFSEGICGNGIVESGEMCDCGSKEPGACDNVDPCCNPQTCQYV